MKLSTTRAGNNLSGNLLQYGARLLLALLFLATASPALALQGQLNINTATLEELQKLPFIGKTKAEAIVKLRQDGQFVDLSKLQDSSIIGPSTYQAILPYLKLSGAHTLNDHPTLPINNGIATQAGPTIITRPGEVKLLTDSKYYETINQLILTAQKQINITMFIFKTGQAKGNRPRYIIEELAAARKRGVKVQVILEKSGYDKELNKTNRHTANLLIKNGISVAFDGSKTTTHAKIAVIDQQFCLLGSHNLTNSALGYNHEASLLINNKELARQLLAYMDDIAE